MATMKKQRQRLTMKIKRILGLDIASARQVARGVLDNTKWVRVGGELVRIDTILTPLLGQPEFRPGCECCGNASDTWKGKRGFITIPVSGQIIVDEFTGFQAALKKIG